MSWPIVKKKWRIVYYFHIFTSWLFEAQVNAKGYHTNTKGMRNTIFICYFFHVLFKKPSNKVTFSKTQPTLQYPKKSQMKIFFQILPQTLHFDIFDIFSSFLKFVEASKFVRKFITFWVLQAFV